MSKEVAKFGDYVTIEMFRYGVDNEFYTHKVVNSLKSNTWQDTPLKHGEGEVIHQRMETILSVIQEGLDERRVIRVLAKDCKLQPNRSNT